MKRVSLLIMALMCVVLMMSCVNDQGTSQPQVSQEVGRTALADSTGGQGFTRLAAGDTGIDFRNEIVDDYALEMLTAVNAGMAAGDYDQDGDIDLFLCGLTTDNKLYRNDGGFKFTDVTDGAGEGIKGTGAYASGAVFTDLNADGNLDLYICYRNHNDALFMGDGKGGFVDETDSRGIVNPGAAVACAPFDADNDGDLDLYVSCHLDDFNRDEFELIISDYRKQKDVEIPEELSNSIYKDQWGIPRHRPNDDCFFLNDGNGNFTNATKAAGLDAVSWSFQAQACDFTNDGWIDLYITSDFEAPDRFMVNNGDGTFTDQASSMVRKTAMFAMGADSGDINGDGLPDLFVADMKSREYKRGKKQSGDMWQWRIEMMYENPQPQMRNMLYVNRGQGWFTEMAEFAGVTASEWTWAARIADLDCDGSPELFTTSGVLRDAMDVDYKNEMKDMLRQGTPGAQLAQYKMEQPTYFTDNLIFTAGADGMHYGPAENNWNMLDGVMGCGASLADFDGDGDMDIIVNNTNAEIGVWRNDQASGNRVTMSLNQPGANSSAVGARVTAHCGEKILMQDVILSRGFATGESGRLYFGLGDATKIDKLEIRWPDLKVQELTDLDAGYHYEIQRGSDLADWQPETFEPMFVQTNVNWTHKEEQLGETEYQREPLLPMGQSSLGAGAGLADFNQDGNLDLYLCGAAGSAGELMEGNGQGGFKPSTALAGMSNPESEEIAALWFEANGDGRTDLLVTCGGVEAEPGSDAFKARLYLNGESGFAEAPLPLPNTPTGAAAAGDIDADGDLDLVIGGHVITGKYAAGAPSYVLLNDGSGSFSIAAGAASNLTAGGQVTDLQFADMDGDFKADLVVSRKWGKVEAMTFDGGKFSSLFALTEAGWWQGLGIGDFDRDGDLDVIAANVGYNTKYHPKPNAPITLFAHDFDQNGTRDLIEVKYRNDGCMLPGRGRSCSGYAIEYIPDRFPTWASFADATLEDVYGEGLETAERYDATKIHSVICVNNGGGQFEVHELPGVSQWAPSFGVAVGDFNGDGNLDAYLANNFFDTQPETGRWDTGYGVLLIGDGDCGFVPSERIESGLSVWGDGRSALAADLNNDNKLDLLLSISQGVPLACINAKGSAGQAVEFSGPAGNPGGVGSTLEFTLDDGSKFVMPVQAGSGFNGSTAGKVVVSLPDGANVTEAVAHWPDGTAKPFELADSGTTTLQ